MVMIYPNYLVMLSNLYYLLITIKSPRVWVLQYLNLKKKPLQYQCKKLFKIVILSVIENVWWVLFVSFLFCLSLSCPADYAGAQCQFPNPCSPSPCRNGGMCRPRTQGNDVEFTCDCTLGFSGPLCLTPVNHACMSSPCRNGGSCSLLTLSTYSCRCPPGWTGTNHVLI